MSTPYDHLATSQPPAAAPQPSAQRVTVVDFDMPFGSMVTLMIKWGIAAIPAVLILAIVGAIAAGVLAGIASAGR